jgi:DNA polymerase IV
MPAPPRILLADCDAMFCAVARLVDPDGAGKSPLLVVGGRRGGRGVVCSASYEARAFGIRSGMPIRTAERLCPDALFVPVPRKACGEKSQEVRAVLEEWSPVVEPASIDEFYLAMSGTEALYRYEPLAATAARIREDVLARTRLSVSIGGGTNRLVAKLAVERAKPHAGGPTPGCTSYRLARRRVPQDARSGGDSRDRAEAPGTIGSLQSPHRCRGGAYR